MLILARVAAGQRQHLLVGAGSADTCVCLSEEIFVLSPGFGCRYSVVLVMMSNTARDVVSTLWKGGDRRAEVRGTTTRDASKKQILRLLSSAGRIQPCLFHFSEVNIELRSLGPADLLAHFLQKRPQKQHVSFGVFIVSARTENEMRN